MEAVNELADRLAVAAGWKPSIAEGRWEWEREGIAVYRHPFPSGRIDPILDLMREIKWEWDGFYRHGRKCEESEVTLWWGVCDGKPDESVTRSGPDLWTALASAVLAAMEKTHG